MPFQRLVDARGTIEQLTAAVGAALVERVGAIGAEGIFQRADERAALVGGQIDAAAFAIGAHVEHGGEIVARACRGKWVSAAEPVTIMQGNARGIAYHDKSFRMFILSTFRTRLQHNDDYATFSTWHRAN